MNPYKSYPGSLYGLTLEKYIENTTLVTNQNEVKQFIQYYLWKLECKQESVKDDVKDILHIFLRDEELQRKIQIVSMISWRNGVISVFPNRISHDAKDKTIFEVLEYYKFHREIIFLYMNEHAINIFQHPSVGVCKESENLHYFHQLRQNWKTEYELLKRNKIDTILDEYNTLKKIYESTSDTEYLLNAQGKLEELKDL